MTFLFLYTELAEYTLACIRALAEKRTQDRIVVVHFPINQEAPFDFDFSIAEFYSIEQFQSSAALEKHFTSLSPAVIICSGWIHPWYTRICRIYRKSAITILTLDNHWKGNLKQWAWLLVSRFTLQSWFHYAWVPGSHQLRYARKLGFPANKILTGFYSCDTNRFLSMGEKFRLAKEAKLPRVLLCVARYIPVKGYEILWDAFIRWQSEQEQDWELWCAGTGADFDKRVLHPKIKHLGFIQKDEWEPIIEKTSIFVLFSLFEPWGVVVHEFAAAGYPLVLSNKVGAAEKFLSPANGWLINTEDRATIDAAFRKIGALDQQSFNQMANASRELAKSLSPYSWVQTLETVLK